MRKGVIFFLCIVLTGCLPDRETSHEKSDQRVSDDLYDSTISLSHIKVGYSGPSLVAPFYVALEATVRTTVEQYGMQYFMADGQGDVIKQVAAIEDLLSKGIQVLILNPLDPKASVEIVNRAEAQGVDVFIVDSVIDDVASYICSLVADNTLNGEILGNWLAETRSEALKIAIISGSQGSPAGREKRLGFVRGLVDGQLHKNGRTNFEIVAHGWGNWSNNGGLKAMEDILVAHPYVNVLLAENDEMAMGAMKAIKEMGKERQITILGYDGQKEALKMIKEGQYAVTVQNSPKILGESIVEIVAKHLNKEQGIERKVFTPSVLITQQNVNQFYSPNALF